MAIISSIKNFIRAVKKHNQHVKRQANAGKYTARFQQKVDSRRKALDTANQNLSKANNDLNLASANINATKTRIRGLDNQLGRIDTDIQNQMQILSNPQSGKKAIATAQSELQRLFAQQQQLKSQRKRFKSDLNTFKGNKKTAEGGVQTATEAQTKATNYVNNITKSYNDYINKMHNYQDPGLGVRTAARIMRDPASLYKEPLRYGAMYGIPAGVGYAYANGSDNTEKTLNQLNAGQAPTPENTGVSPDDVYGTEALLATGGVVPKDTAPAYIPVRNPSAAYPSYAPVPGTIQDVPEDQWAAFAPPGPLVVGNSAEQYSAFAPGPEHLPDVPQDEWDNYAPPQITNPLKEAMRIQLERERQAQATKS